MSTSEHPHTSSAPRRGALAGLAVTLGWVLHDFAIFFPSGQPEVFLELLPISLALALAAAVVGALATRRVVFAALVLVTLVAAVVPLWRATPLPRADLWLPRSAFLLLLAGAGTLWLHARLRSGLVVSGLCLGVLACLAKTVYRHGWLADSLPVAVGVLLAGGALLLPRGAARTLGAGLACLLTLAWIGLRAAPRFTPSRPDLPPPAVAAPAARPNLLLVVLDTVRADRLASYGYERDTAPRLETRAARDFTRYESARSTSSWTLPSHASLFTGLMPAQHGCAHAGFIARPLAEKHVTIAERLRELGYRTAAVPSNQVYLGAQFGLERGFEHFDDRRAAWVDDYYALAQMTGRRLAIGHVGYRDGRTISDLALDWLAEHGDERFFLMLNYMDAHKPYVQPDELRGLFEDREPLDPLAPRFEDQPLLYDRGIWYADRELERVFRWLEEQGHYEDTAVVVTSDHGEGLGDHGLYFHGLHLFEALIRVPLFVKPAGERERAVEETPIHGAEVHDLMLALVGVEPPSRPTTPVTSEYYTSGGKEPVVHTENPAAGTHDIVTWIEGSRKYLVFSTGRVLAYDLVRDPGERAPLELEPEELEQARGRARAWWDAHPIEILEEDGIDESDRARLEALGYG